MPKLERPGEFVINFEDFGDPEAPPVILLHDAANDLRMWAPLIRPLAENYRVIAPDLRGHGQTSCPPFDTSAHASDANVSSSNSDDCYSISAFAEDVRALMEFLEIGVCVLVGTGFGGSVALELAVHAPERFAGLVLSDASAAPDNPAYGDSYRAYAADCQAATELVARAGPAALGKRAAAAIASPFLASGVRSRYASLERDGYLGAAHAAQTRPDLLPVLEQRLTMPVLICAGTDDPLLSASEVMAAHLPHARLVTFTDTAHGVPLQRPEAFGKAIFAFFREIEDAHGA